MDAELLKEIEEEIEEVLDEGEPTYPVRGRTVPASALLGIPKERSPLTKSCDEELVLRFLDWVAADRDCLMICQRDADGVRQYTPLHKDRFSVDDFYVGRIAFTEALIEMGLRAIEECKFAAETLGEIRVLPTSGS